MPNLSEAEQRLVNYLEAQLVECYARGFEDAIARSDEEANYAK